MEKDLEERSQSTRVTKSPITCTDCHVLNCRDRAKAFPPYCLTTKLSSEVINASVKSYHGDGVDARLGWAAAEVIARSRGTYSRVEETIAFAHSFGAKKIGIAACMALIKEAQIFARYLKLEGFVVYGVVCKIGATDKLAAGYPENFKTTGSTHESMCNPLLQAELLNKEMTDLNITIGLCVGHDTIFFRHSEAPVTTLISKDRALNHNPIRALELSPSSR